MGVSIPFETIIKRFEDLNCKLLLTEDKYSGTQKQKADYICSCGHIQSDRSISSILSKKLILCRDCMLKRKGEEYLISMGYDFKSINQRFIERNLKLLTIKDIYHKTDRVEYECNTCHSKYSIKLENITDGTGCKYCKNQQIKDNLWNSINNLAIESNLQLLTTVEEFGGRDSYITLQCNCLDKNIFSTSVECFLYDNKRQCNNCGREKIRGENSYRWKGGISGENERIRHSAEYINWRKTIFTRDNFTCQCCGDNSGGNLEAHHILGFAEYPDLRLDLSNGITLCKSCHNFNQINSFHYTYGSCNNTKEQLQEYIDNKRKQLNLSPIKIDDIVHQEISILDIINADIDFKPKMKIAS